MKIVKQRGRHVPKGLPENREIVCAGSLGGKEVFAVHQDPRFKSGLVFQVERGQLGSEMSSVSIRDVSHEGKATVVETELGKLSIGDGGDVTLNGSPIEVFGFCYLGGQS
jgi:hypothetical protein